MKVGIVFHKNPFASPSGIDLVRLRAIAGGLLERGIETEILAPVQETGILEGRIPVRMLEELTRRGAYDLLKTCYHFSIELIGDFEGPVVSRIVRVVDENLPERDEPIRERLLKCQQLIYERSAAVALNNVENEQRWRHLYGDRQQVVLVPTGCPAEIPPVKGNPYPPGERVVLFLGSIAAPRMLSMINEAARRLNGRATVHLVGLNKIHLYGGDEDRSLDALVVDHGEVPETDIWDYVRHARVGLALATGPYRFDNDVSKILNYLRGGLPVLSEEPIINNELVHQTGFGKTFAFGDVEDMMRKVEHLLNNPPWERRESVMRLMVSDHSWKRRVETYVRLFKGI